MSSHYLVNFSFWNSGTTRWLTSKRPHSGEISGRDRVSGGGELILRRIDNGTRLRSSTRYESRVTAFRPLVAAGGGQRISLKRGVDWQLISTTLADVSQRNLIEADSYIPADASAKKKMRYADEQFDSVKYLRWGPCKWPCCATGERQNFMNFDSSRPIVWTALPSDE